MFVIHACFPRSCGFDCNRYDGDGTPASRADCAITDFNQAQQCAVTFDIEEDMEPPIYVYYRISGLLQNYRCATNVKQLYCSVHNL